MFGDRLDEVKLGSVVVTLQRRQNKLQKEFDDFTRHVNELFLSTMAGTVFKNLQTLASGPENGEGPIRRFDEDHLEDLIREMKLLRDLGYVGDFNEHAIREAKRGNLADYVKVTSLGERFIELREEQKARTVVTPRS